MRSQNNSKYILVFRKKYSQKYRVEEYFILMPNETALVFSPPFKQESNYQTNVYIEFGKVGGKVFNYDLSFTSEKAEPPIYTIYKNDS